MITQRKAAAVLFLLPALALGLRADAQPQPSPETGTPAGRRDPLKTIDSLLGLLAREGADLRKFVAAGDAPFASPAADDPGSQLTEPEKHGLSESRTRREADCRVRFSMKGTEASPIPGGTDLALEQYYECRALTERNVGVCSDLDAVRIQEDQVRKSRNMPGQECRRNALRLATARAAIAREPGAMADCSEEIAQLPELRIPAANVARACAALLGDGDAASVCARMSSLASKPFGPEMRRHCALYVGMHRGDDTACAASDKEKADNPDLRDCAGVAAYRRAQAARDPNQCGSELLCRAMMGQKNVCAQYETNYRDVYCRRFAEGKSKVETGLILMARAKDLQEHPKPSRRDLYWKALLQKKADIAAVEKELEADLEAYEPRSSGELKARKQKYAARRDALQTFMKGLQDVAKKPAEPADGPKPDDAR
jgi:hypothetical protein